MIEGLNAMNACLHDLGLNLGQEALLRRHGFSPDVFATLQKQLVAGAFTQEANYVKTPVAPPEPADIIPWPSDGTPEATRLTNLGHKAIDAGQVAVCILNGGMATRFGGRVKGVVDVLPGKSFLALHLEHIANLHSPVPVFLMNSFATEHATEAHLLKHAFFGLPQSQVHLLSQNMSMRMRTDGSLYRDHHGQPSFYAPGHGDVFEVLAKSPAFAQFVARGGKAVMVANVDNIAATLSPKIVGFHLEMNRPVTVEVTARAPGDMGGAPMRINNRVVILENFRIPPEVHVQQIRVFNTNTLWLSVDMVRSDLPLTWFRADKYVDGEHVVQFERLMGEITSFADSTYLEVPRTGPEGRFMPIKTPDDLATVTAAFSPKRKTTPHAL